MKKSICLLASLIISSAVFKAEGAGKVPRLAIGAEAGTTGLGVSAWLTLNKQWSLNAVMASAEESGDYSTEGLDYAGDIDLDNDIIALNWHPGGGSFHFILGMILTDNFVSVAGQPEDGNTFNIGGESFTQDQVESITGDVEWEKSSAPYLGIGFARKLSKDGLSFYINAGVMEAGSAEASLSAVGNVVDQAEFQALLRVEEEDLNEELDEYEFYPVVRLGLMFRF
ncbi:hypothetical protein MLD52_06585 [Puniceicoccaceae bacterium K14]|nr:hypothetical protein [Puniceicoccaceae bacterium K14]